MCFIPGSKIHYIGFHIEVSPCLFRRVLNWLYLLYSPCNLTPNTLLVALFTAPPGGGERGHGVTDIYTLKSSVGVCCVFEFVCSLVLGAALPATQRRPTARHHGRCAPQGAACRGDAARPRRRRPRACREGRFQAFFLVCPRRRSDGQTQAPGDGQNPRSKGPGQATGNSDRGGDRRHRHDDESQQLLRAWTGICTATLRGALPADVPGT